MPASETPHPPRPALPEEPRAVRTREALEVGLWELLRDQDLADITVAALCRRAGVHRTTFYGHYRNILEFAASVYAEVVNRLGAVDVDQRGTGRTQAEVGVLYADALRRILVHTRSEHQTYRALFATGTFQEALADGLRPRFLLALYAWQGYGLVPVLDCDVAAAFLGGAYAAWIEQWVAGEDDDVEAWLASLTNLLPAWWPRDGFPGV